MLFRSPASTALAIEAGAAIQAGDPRAAMASASELLRDEKRRRGMADAGKKFCEAHRGSAERQLAVCLEVLGSKALKPD